MTANPSSLQARLDAMVREADKNVYGHAEDCRLRECGDSCSCGLVEQNIALDLLRQLAESEAKVKALNAELAANAALEAKLGDAEGALRAMASYVGNGGYNAGTVDPKVFEAKIREGIDFIIRVEVNRALSDADTRAHAWWAHTGPHKSLREAIHNGTPAWVREPEASRKKGAEHGE